jgi:hypothetical protein
MNHAKSRPSTQLRIALFSAVVIATSAFACGGIDESPLFSGDGSASSGGSDSGAKTDSGSSKKDGGITVADSGGNPPPVGGTVQCTTGSCDIDSSQVCCYSTDTQSGTCELQANCTGDNSFPIPCDSTADCAELGQPGTVCCAQADNNGDVTNVECKAASNCRADQGQTNLCDPAATNPCPNGGTCQPSTVSLPGYYICVS